MLRNSLLHTQNWRETIGQLEHYHFPPYITLAHLFSAPVGWEIQPRSLNQFQLQYVVSGGATYHIEGQDYATRPGDLLFHRPGERHFVRMTENTPYVCISIVFHFGHADFAADTLFGGRHYLGPHPVERIEKKLSLIVDRFRQPGPANQLLCQGLLLQLLAELSEAHPLRRPNAEVPEKTTAKLILVRNYIVHHYNRNVQIQELEAISGLSKNYLTNRFRNMFGMTPFEYMIRMRVEKAKELAIHTHLSVGEIAGRVGYADVHTFGKMFKRKTGVSLSQFCASLVTLH